MGTSHLVIDGSNIATEGRSLPSLAQLLGAVEAAKQDLNPDTVTVIVDATFGHRIEEPEQEQFEDKISSGEIIIPPAGIIGRGDAFILEVADKADAVVLSNDSFQEFHGDYRWLFDEGRLLGGKHVPGVGWIFLARSPVRGPASRKAISEAKKRSRTGAPASKKPAAKKKGSGRRRGGGKDETVPAKAAKAAANAAKKVAQKVKQPKKSGGGEPEPYNEPLPFIEFVGAHAVGSTVEGEVEQFSSHGAYVMVGDTRCYVPLRSMGDPAPRSARDVLDPGETRSFVVEAIDTPRRGIDLTLVPLDAAGKTKATAKAKAKALRPQPKEDKQRPAEPETKPDQPEEHLVTDAEVDDENLSVSQRRRLRAQLEAQEASASAGPETDAVDEDSSPKSKTREPAEKTAEKRSPARGRAAKKTTAPTKKSARASSAKKSTGASSTTKKSARASSAKKPTAATKKTTRAKSAKKSARSSSEKSGTKTASTKKTGSKRSTAAKKAPAKKAPAKKAPAKKSSRSTSARKSTRKGSDG